MTIYDILGIEPTATIDDIRLAYQQKLKAIDMSRNIEEYQTLRDAYNQALKNSHNNQPTDSLDIKLPEEKPIILEDEVILKKEEPTIEPVKEEQTVEFEKVVEKIEDNEVENVFVDDFKLFIKEKSYYNNPSAWENLLSPFFIDRKIQQIIKSFLLKHHMLLDDKTRFQLLHLVNLTELDFTSEDQKLVFTNHIHVNNFLIFDFYSYIPKDSRDQYFSKRYQLYRFIQTDDNSVEMGINEVNLLNKTNYQDDDLSYLISIYSLIHPGFLPIEEIKEKLEEITLDKYLHDKEILIKYLNLLEDNQSQMVTNADIISLSWVSDSVKETLMSRLKEIRLSLSKPETPKRNTIPKKEQPIKPYKPFNFWKFIAGFFIIISIIFGVIGFMYTDNSDDSISFIDNFIDWEDDEGFDEYYNDVEYKEANRETNVKVNYDVYNWLVSDEEIDADFSNIREDVFVYLDKIKENNEAELVQLNVDDLFEDIHETHDLTNKDTVITYTSFENSETLYLKTTTNNLNEITKIETIKKEEMPKNNSLGNLDATLFFMDDLTTYFDDLDSYLLDLEELYDKYLTEELYEKLMQIDEEQYSYLTEFAYAKPYLISSNEKTVLLLTNFEDDFLFLELNDELKINTIYFDFFEDIPDEYLQKANSLSEDFNTDNPWSYELGVNF